MPTPTPYDPDCFACASVHTRDHICPLHAQAGAMLALAQSVIAGPDTIDRATPDPDGNWLLRLLTDARALVRAVDGKVTP